MKDSDLQKLSLKELRLLRLHIDEAIRAAIRAKKGLQSPPNAAGRPAEAPTVIIDLEQARDAWLASRKKA